MRRLIDRHIHTIRKYGTKYVERWEFGECVAEPTNKTAQKGSLGKSLAKYNPAAMGAYTSSELHTVERRIPKYVIVFVALLVLVPVLALTGVHVMRRLAKQADDKAASAPASSSSAPQAVSSVSSSRREKPIMTRDEWLARFQPRVSGMPWSAPAHDDRKIEGTPELYCVIMDVGEAGEHCRCNTEQGTRATVPDSMCKTIAREGTDNPYRRPKIDPGQRRRGREQGGEPKAVEVVTAARPAITHTEQPGRSADAEQVSRARIGTVYLPPDKTVVSSSF